jgi:hypothetical protein
MKKVLWALTGMAGTLALITGSIVSANTLVKAEAVSPITTVSVWDGSTRTAPTKTVIMNNKTFYLIENAAQLAYLGGSKSDSNNYLLVNDIDLNNKDWTPIASIEFNAIDHCQFTGILDGNGDTVKNYKLPGLNQDGGHRDYKWASQVSKSAKYASSIGFIGRLGTGGVIKNFNFVGSSVQGGVGTTAYYWYNGGIVGHNFGTIRNISASSIQFRSDLFSQSGTLGFYSLVQDSGIGIICGRNESTMICTTVKNSYLYCVETGGKFQGADHFIQNCRYGQNCGFNNEITGWVYSNNYYYNVDNQWSSSYGTAKQVDSHSIAVSSETSFDPNKIGNLEGTSALTDNFDDINTSGDIYQDQTSISLDYASKLFAGDCASCTSSFIQNCINDYNTSDVAKNVYNNLKSNQTYLSTTTEMNAKTKLDYFVDKYGLSYNTSGAAKANKVIGVPNVSYGIAGIAVLASVSVGAYFFARKKEER